MEKGGDGAPGTGISMSNRSRAGMGLHSPRMVGSPFQLYEGGCRVNWEEAGQ